MVASDASIRAWSKDKLDLLGKYLHAYSTIMHKQKERWLRSYSYIDAFAGIGQYADREMASYVDGSPLVALRCDPPFDDYTFIEASPNRLDTLRHTVLAAFPSHRVRFCRGDANSVLRDTVVKEITRAPAKRGFVFLDPYGLQIDYGTIELLAQAGTLDVFVNFSVMGISRILGREQPPDVGTVSLLTRVMGDSGMLDDLYTRQPELFGGPDYVSRPRLDPERIAEEYRGRVAKVFPFLSEGVLMLNSRGAPLYVLFLASHNKNAAKITNQIFGRYKHQQRHRYG